MQTELYRYVFGVLHVGIERYFSNVVQTCILQWNTNLYYNLILHWSAQSHFRYDPLDVLCLVSYHWILVLGSCVLQPNSTCRITNETWEIRFSLNRFSVTFTQLRLNMASEYLKYSLWVIWILLIVLFAYFCFSSIGAWQQWKNEEQALSSKFLLSGSSKINPSKRNKICLFGTTWTEILFKSF